MAGVRDQTLVDLADPTRLTALLTGTPGHTDQAQAQLMEMLARSYELPSARIDHISGVSITGLRLQEALHPVSRVQGSVSQAVPTQTRSDVQWCQTGALAPIWIDLLADLQVSLVAEVDPGGIDTVLLQSLDTFTTLEDFRSQFQFLDLDAFMAEHDLHTVEDLRAAFHYLRSEIHLRIPPTFDPQMAADFLVSRTGDTDRRAALELAGELGGLPLALEQAAAYVQASGQSLAEYLALYRKRRPEMLARGEPTGYPETVATTWRLAFEDLQQASPCAAGLLRLLASCAPEAIPLRLLLQPRPDLAGQLGEEVAPVLVPLLHDKLAAGDAIAALRRYSLIRPSADGSVSVHRLVQAVTADQMPAELAQAWRQAAAALIEAAIPGDTDRPATWPVCAALLPHARALLDLTGGGMWQIALYLGESGSYPTARDLFQVIAGAYRDDDGYGAEHPDTLAARGNVARWTGKAGDAAGARDQCAALLPIQERVFGPGHPAALTTRGSLAYWTGEAGDAASARDQCAALLPIQERVFGPEHPAIITARGNLARWTGEAGDAAGARDQFAALLAVRERVLGDEHPTALFARSNLARWTGVAGDAAAARDLYAALLPVVERVLGPEHPDTLTVRDNLALLDRADGGPWHGAK